jgi:hypothetical protein
VASRSGASAFAGWDDDADVTAEPTEPTEPAERCLAGLLAGRVAWCESTGGRLLEESDNGAHLLPRDYDY